MDEPTSRAVEALLAFCAEREHSIIAIWVFGSRARGVARVDSDVDLGVLVREPGLGVDALAAMDVAGRAAGVDVDVIEMQKVNPTLAWEVITTGKLVYEEQDGLDGLVVQLWVRSARFRAADDAHRYRIIAEAQRP